MLWYPWYDWMKASLMIALTLEIRIMFTLCYSIMQKPSTMSPEISLSLRQTRSSWYPWPFYQLDCLSPGTGNKRSRLANVYQHSMRSGALCHKVYYWEFSVFLCMINDMNTECQALSDVDGRCTTVYHTATDPLWQSVETAITWSK